ncbi:MAG: hypothetical protein IKL94_01960 [Clostridia bacterium]|nr:hypothetical protein [Clostridia bacterium]
MGKTKVIKDIKNNIRENKATFIVYVILRGLVLASMLVALVRRDFESAFVCGLSLVLFLLPAFFERQLNLRLPTALEIVILLFIFASEILGEIGYYYVKVPHWDTLMHTVNGFIFAAVGFSLVDILNKSKHVKFELSPIYVSVVAFCFSMTIGIFWEFFEFAVDYFFKTDMQKDRVLGEIASIAFDSSGGNKTIHINQITELSVNGGEYTASGYIDIGLFDTMKDLFVNFIGAAVFSIIGFFYVKNRGKGKVAKMFIPTSRE